jgi:PhoH-like ATPase
LKGVIKNYEQRGEEMNYILDTNIILRHFTDLIEQKSDCGIIIPNIVLEELDHLKTKEGEVGYLARKVINHLFQIKKYGNLREWIKLQNNLSIKIESEFDHDLTILYSNNDDLIIACLSYCERQYKNCILLSNDLNCCLKSEALGFKTEQINYKNTLYKNVYKGYEEVEVEEDLINDFYKQGYLDIINVPIIPYPNQFIILKSKYNSKSKAVTIFINDRLEKCKYLDEKPYGIKSRNLEQKLAIELLMRNEIPMVSFTGNYGSAKSFLQLGVSLEKIMNGEFKKILLVKPPMPLDKNLMVGYKKGGIFEKYINALGSITSNLEALKDDPRDKTVSGVQLLEYFIEKNQIEIISVEDILGSSYNNCIILAEEMQLLTKENMEALLSRVGNSRIFINGDLKQSSRLINKDPRDMGLYHMIDVFKDSKLSGHLTLQSIQRSEFVRELSERW